MVQLWSTDPGAPASTVSVVVSGTRQVKPVQDVVLPADTPAVVRKLPGTSTDGQTGGDSEQLLVVTAPGVTSVVYDDGHGQRRPVPLVDGAAIVPRATDRADDKDAVLVTAAGSTTRIGVYDQRTLKTVVPDVRGLRLPAATRRLGAAGLVTGEPGHLLRACTGRRCVDDLVAVQSPPPGERITTGTSVQLTVIPGLISTSPAPPTPTTPYASGTPPVADLPSPPTTSASPAPADALVGADGLHDQPHWPRRGDEAAMRRVLVAGERSHSPVTASLAVLWSGRLRQPTPSSVSSTHRADLPSWPLRRSETEPSGSSARTTCVTVSGSSPSSSPATSCSCSGRQARPRGRWTSPTPAASAP